MINRILFWLNNSRLFSLPMTIMSWLVVFLFASKNDGNCINGLVALVGISFAHLATNLFDDYLDYKRLSASCGFDGAPLSKCSYIRNGDAKLSELLFVICIYLFIAVICGGYLTFACGAVVPLLAIIGGVIVLSYPLFSSCGLSEAAVGIAFGPLLFEGVYYVMCREFSLFVLILSLAVVVFTIVLLYVHTLLDYDGDMAAEKKTLCCRIGNKSLSLKFLGCLLSAGYVLVLSLVYLSKNYYFLLNFLTVPYAIQLYGAIYSYNYDKFSLPETTFMNFPMEKTDTPAFHQRLFLARNLMIYFSFFTAQAIVLSD